MTETGTRRLQVLCIVLVCASFGVSCASSPYGGGAATGSRGKASAFTVEEAAPVPPGVGEAFDEAVALLEAHEYEQGIAAMTRVAEAAPDLAAPRIDLGIAWARLGELERAREELGLALAIAPRHPVALNELGIVQRRLGRFGDARKTWERLLRAVPDFHYAHRNLAILCDLHLADPDCALEHYERHAQLADRDEVAVIWLAEFQWRHDRKE